LCTAFRHAQIVAAHYQDRVGFFKAVIQMVVIPNDLREPIYFRRHE
jgi:hypothetical protein